MMFPVVQGPPIALGVALFEKVSIETCRSLLKKVAKETYKLKLGACEIAVERKNQVIYAVPCSLWTNGQDVPFFFRFEIAVDFFMTFLENPSLGVQKERNGNAMSTKSSVDSSSKTNGRFSC